jgi:hypothetical protein
MTLHFVLTGNNSLLFQMVAMNNKNRLKVKL